MGEWITGLRRSPMSGKILAISGRLYIFVQPGVPCGVICMYIVRFTLAMTGGDVFQARPAN